MEWRGRFATKKIVNVSPEMSGGLEELGEFMIYKGG